MRTCHPVPLLSMTGLFLFFSNFPPSQKNDQLPWFKLVLRPSNKHNTFIRSCKHSRCATAPSCEEMQSHLQVTQVLYCSTPRHDYCPLGLGRQEEPVEFVAQDSLVAMNTYDLEAASSNISFWRMLSRPSRLSWRHWRDHKGQQILVCPCAVVVNCGLTGVTSSSPFTSIMLISGKLVN